jgi:transcriptional regulator with XRE-family HTH domain
MSDIHMGELLEKALRRKGLNITKVASALGITRRTLYTWFNKKVIDQQIMEKISQVIEYDAQVNPIEPIIIKQKSNQLPLVRDEAYWQARYIDLLERYSKLIKETTSKK